MVFETKRLLRANERGSSLILLIVVIAVITIVAGMATRETQTQLKAIQHTKIQKEIGDLENLIKIRFDCAKTAALGHSHFYDRMGHPVLPISGSYMVVGGWKVKVVERNATSGEYVVNAKKGLTDRNLFQGDALTCL
jgi:type II secretory pathway pseudopilin PulG